MKGSEAGHISHATETVIVKAVYTLSVIELPVQCMTAMSTCNAPSSPPSSLQDGEILFLLESNLWHVFVEPSQL